MIGKSKFIAAGLLIVAAALYLIVSNTGGTVPHFLTVEELRALGEDALDRNITISGAMLGNTIAYNSSIPRVTFTIVQMPADPGEAEQAGGLAAALHTAADDPDAPRLGTVYDDVKPDILRNEAQAIVRGRLGEDGRFYAAEALLKCPSRYEEDVPDQAEEIDAG
jgi:cytochrome c-type biogenesis protein CcmE